MNIDKTFNGETLVLVAAKRTPFGTFGGALKNVSATDLAVHASQAALSASKVSPALIDHVIFGNVIQSSADAAYLARHVGLKCGVPIPTPAVTVNRLCGSGFEALAQSSRLLRTGEATVVLAGGTENMSQCPYVLRSARFGYRMNHGEMEDSLVSGLYDTYAKLPMAMTAERLAEKYKISREECDAFALLSQKNATAAWEAGHYKDEVAPMTLKERGKEKIVEKDEHFRADSSMEGLAKLKPVFKENGVVTAGNASGICDGAASLVITTESMAKSHGWTPLAHWITSHVVGCLPQEMGIGPVGAVQGILKKSGVSQKDIALAEINEAFAAQVLSVQRELKLDEKKLNVEGGAIAIGHPLAASGARLVAHLIYRLQKQGGGIGLATACIGGGQGMAVLIRV